MVSSSFWITDRLLAMTTLFEIAIYYILTNSMLIVIIFIFFGII